MLHHCRLTERDGEQSEVPGQQELSVVADSY